VQLTFKGNSLPSWLFGHGVFINFEGSFMKAFLITPDHATQSCAVQVVDVRERPLETSEGGVDADYQHIYELLGATHFDLVRTGKGELAKHCGYVDGEGLLTPQAGYILCPDLYQLPLAGPVLLLAEAFHEEFGGIACAASIPDDEVRRLFTMSYVSRRYAKAAHELAEEQTAAMYPDVVVLKTSSEM
jgi:hypothetical protein